MTTRRPQSVRLACSRPARRLPGSPPTYCLRRRWCSWGPPSRAKSRRAPRAELGANQPSRRQRAASCSPPAPPEAWQIPAPNSRTKARRFQCAARRQLLPLAPTRPPAPRWGAGGGGTLNRLPPRTNGSARSPGSPGKAPKALSKGRRAALLMMPQPVKGFASWAARRPTLDRPGRQQVRRAAAT